MRRATSLADAELETVLREGGVAVLKTDTLYGLVARALDEEAVERVYEIKGRAATKPPIVLIASTSQLLSPAPSQYKDLIDSIWPGPNSLIIPTIDAPTWLSRGTETVAYRLPDDPSLASLIAKVGPLVAPSANPEGSLPATTAKEAVAYFGEAVDIYVDSGQVGTTSPSALFRLNEQGELDRLR